MDKKVKGEIIKSGNIVLSGFMGSGKTTVGRRLAAALDMQFVDMDLYIEKKTGMTVKEIFAEYGELHFRALETETVKELAQSNHFVIATGGGTLMQPQNVEASIKAAVPSIISMYRWPPCRSASKTINAARFCRRRTAAR